MVKHVKDFTSILNFCPLPFFISYCHTLNLLSLPPEFSHLTELSPCSTLVFQGLAKTLPS